MNNRQQDRQQLNDLVNGPRYVSCFILMARSKSRGLKGWRAILSTVPCGWAHLTYAPNTSSAHP